MPTVAALFPPSIGQTTPHECLPQKNARLDLAWLTVNDVVYLTGLTVTERQSNANKVIVHYCLHL